MRDYLFDIIDGHGDKTPFSDHQEWNQTFLLTYAYEHATEIQKQVLINTRWKPCHAITQKQLLALYTDTGTIRRAQEEVNTKLQRCNDLLVQLQETIPYQNNKYIQYFKDMIALLKLNH